MLVFKLNNIEILSKQVLVEIVIMFVLELVYKVISINTNEEIKQVYIMVGLPTHE